MAFATAAGESEPLLRGVPSEREVTPSERRSKMFRYAAPLFAAAVALGAGFLYWSVKLMRRPEPSTAMDTFKYSIVYLALLFIALVVDHYLF